MTETSHWPCVTLGLTFQSPVLGSGQLPIWLNHSTSAQGSQPHQMRKRRTVWLSQLGDLLYLACPCLPPPVLYHIEASSYTTMGKLKSAHSTSHEFVIHHLEHRMLQQLNGKQKICWRCWNSQQLVALPKYYFHGWVAQTESVLWAHIGWNVQLSVPMHWDHKEHCKLWKEVN